ncbi:MAG: S41 family peptidase [Pseudomonadota bacterium]
MKFDQDLALIKDVVERRDPAFDAVPPEAMQAHWRVLEDAAGSGRRDAFLLAAMRLIACPGNGHTRLIPNAAISTLPIRFVALGGGIYATQVPEDAHAARDLPLVAVNDVPTDMLWRRIELYLAGVPQRQRVIGPIMLAWPAAIARLTDRPPEAPVTYQFERATGGHVSLPITAENTMPAPSLYPIYERGTLDPGEPLGPVADASEKLTYLRLPDFSGLDPSARAAEMAQAVDAITQAPKANIILDVRNNPGGNFFTTQPLRDALAQHWQGRRCVALVNKFTFSAAIVFVALIKAGLKARCVIAGEAMGDATRFYAEGDTCALPQSGAGVRYSTAYHDWQTGKAAPNTPVEIAKQLVAAGHLEPDHTCDITAADLRQGRDPQLDAARALCAKA